MIPMVQTGIQEGDNGAMVSSWADLGSADIVVNADQMAEKLEADQLNYSYQLEQYAPPSVLQQARPGPTGPNPSVDPYPGDYGFVVKFHRLSDNIKNKSWDVSFSFNYHLIYCTTFSIFYIL